MRKINTLNEMYEFLTVDDINDFDFKIRSDSNGILQVTDVGYVDGKFICVVHSNDPKELTRVEELTYELENNTVQDEGILYDG
jgi:uncharacterized protein YegJ (DUF2314 family)